MTHDDEQAQGQAMPLSDARLASVLAVVRLLTVPGVMAPEAADAIQDVLAEVERLLGREARREAREAQLREIVAAVATKPPVYYAAHEGSFCTFCNGYVPGNVATAELYRTFTVSQFPHAADCPVIQARALLEVTESEATHGK